MRLGNASNFQIETRDGEKEMSARKLEIMEESKAAHHPLLAWFLKPKSRATEAYFSCLCFHQKMDDIASFIT